MFLLETDIELSPQCKALLPSQVSIHLFGGVTKVYIYILLLPYIFCKVFWMLSMSLNNELR